MRFSLDSVSVVVHGKKSRKASDYKRIGSQRAELKPARDFL